MITLFVLVYQIDWKKGAILYEYDSIYIVQMLESQIQSNTCNQATH
jgi:hypothetical protein